MLITTVTTKGTNNDVTYCVFDTKTGIRYNLFLCLKNTYPVRCKVDGVNAFPDAWPIEMSGEEALDFWRQLSHHEDTTDAGKKIYAGYMAGEKLLNKEA